jgi:AraC-like DNA-binding protein
MSLLNPIAAVPNIPHSPILLDVVVERMDGQLASAYNHTQTNIFFVEEAEGCYELEHGKVRAAAGDLLVVPPQSAFSLEHLVHVRGWFISFDSINLMETVPFFMSPQVSAFLQSSDKLSQHFRVSPLDHVRWQNRMKCLENESKEKSSGFTEIAHNLLLLCLIDIARLTPLPSLPRGEQHLSQSELLLNKIFRFIKTNYPAQISLCDVAKAVNRSPSYLTDLVRRETGQTVLNWIIRYRLREARRLLEHTNLPIQKIAVSIGYLDTGHFIRQFNRDTGKTPRAWRRIHQVKF